MVTTDQCCIQRGREGVPPLQTTPPPHHHQRAPAEDLGRGSLARPKSPSHSWVGSASQKTNGLSPKVQGKDAGQGEIIDFTLVIEISPEQQRIGGKNFQLKRKDNDNYNTCQFLRTY